MHIAAVFGQGQTDRIPVRTMQGFRPILDYAGVTSKEVITQPDKYVKALAAVYEHTPSDALAIQIGDPSFFAEIAGLSFKEFRALGPEKSLLSDKSSMDKLKLPESGQYERIDYFREICKEAGEELGIKPKDSLLLQFSHEYVWKSEVETEHVRTYLLDYEGPFNLHPEEISEGRYWSVKELKSAAGTGILTPNLEEELRLLKIL